MSSRPGPRLTTRCADDHTRQSRAAKLEVAVGSKWTCRVSDMDLVAMTLAINPKAAMRRVSDGV